MNTLQIIIDGNPVAMPRPRFTKSGRTYYPKQVQETKDRITKAIKDCATNNCWPMPDKKQPLKVTMQFVHPRINRLRTEQRTYKTTRPDIDNIAKMYLDCCTKAEIWHDDNQVCILSLSDHYAGIYEQAHTTIIIQEIQT
jgi:Holliday junction resolvase RusA-like endonuclease